MRSNSAKAKARLLYTTFGLFTGFVLLSSCGSGDTNATKTPEAETNTASAEPDGSALNSANQQSGGPVITARPGAQNDNDDDDNADADADQSSAPESSPTTVEPAETTTSTTAPPANTDSLLLYGWGVAGGWSGNHWDVGDWDSDPGSLGDWSNKEVTIINIDGVRGTTTTGEPTLICDPIGTFGLRTQLELEYSENYPDYGFPEFGVISDWNPVPRTWTDVSPLPDVYLQAIESALSNAGLDPTTAVVDQAIRVDLEGDGVDEVLISANDNYSYGTGATPQSYSIVLLRKVINEQVETAVLFSNFGQPGEEPSAYFARSRIAGFADLSGDGKLEVITQEDYYEGGAIIAWEYVNDDLGIDVILSAGCGA